MRHFLTLLTFGLVFYSTLSAQDLHFKDKPLPCVEKNLPLIIHVLADEEGQVLLEDNAVEAFVARTREFFEPICLDIEVCGIERIDNFQFLTIDSLQEYEELLITYNVPGKINVYVVESFSHVVDICGNAPPFGIFGMDTTAIILSSECFPANEANLAHQIGHFLGLYNTHLGDELVSRAECEMQGDSLCDTPADNYQLGSSLVDYIITSAEDPQQICRYINGETDADGAIYCPDVGNVMSNYGNTSLECRCGFSADQYRKMARTCRQSLQPR